MPIRREMLNRTAEDDPLAGSLDAQGTQNELAMLSEPEQPMPPNVSRVPIMPESSGTQRPNERVPGEGCLLLSLQVRCGVNRWDHR